MSLGTLLGRGSIRNAGQALLPAHVLAVDLAEIGDVERVLVAGLAGIVVDALDAAAKGLADEALGNAKVFVVVADAHAMIGGVVARGQDISIELRLFVVYIVDVDIMGITFDDGGGHHHIPSWA
jgi:hypothetical protein